MCISSTYVFISSFGGNWLLGRPISRSVHCVRRAVSSSALEAACFLELAPLLTGLDILLRHCGFNNTRKAFLVNTASAVALELAFPPKIKTDCTCAYENRNTKLFHASWIHGMQNGYLPHHVMENSYKFLWYIAAFTVVR
jgi:hypothetical protein